ncbi:hypothetical protein FisN_2Hh377 [Fistulifera solaris]|uniref:Glycogenin glucosyltransferase n=1 Tax=Fistulifera solaris TaxID=1519565 RepID=A0A1Z5KK36_FISSO|nr:hypothetical protein FisN_2Hh377 [Fistulifera solaris]|eukprot:GAX26680.1 hypothetical protein FisN_2Hh377 [Fistulifera solaris]
MPGHLRCQFRGVYLLLFLLIEQQWRAILKHSSTTEVSNTPQATLHSKRTVATTTRFAYAFLVAGCDPARPAYRPFLSNIAVATRLLAQHGSQAEVIVLVQMDFRSPYETLPENDLFLLLSSSSLRVHIHYIPKTPFQSYYRTQFDKFRILNFTQYDQGILFMDADVMPLTNLDYLFSLSTTDDRIKDNWVVAGPIAPANGGFFLLRPTPGAFERVAALLREQTTSHNRTRLFDSIQGWGHAVGPSDYWETRTGKRGREWTFYAAHADQGFLYHWVKYEQKNVTIVVGATVQNWGCCDEHGQVQLESTFPLRDFDLHSTNHTVSWQRKPPPTCWSVPRKECLPIYGDFIHFGGKRKPWMKPPPSNLTRATQWDSPNHLWYRTFWEINSELGLNLTASEWLTPEDPPLGLKPGKRQAFQGPPIELSR